MADTLERRYHWSRIIGVERRKAPFHYLNGQPLPDPTRLEDEDFDRAEQERQKDERLGRKPSGPREDPDRLG